MVELYNAEQTPWEMIREDVVGLERMHFGEGGFQEDRLKAGFMGSKNASVIVRDQGRLVGFVYAEPSQAAYDEIPGYYLTESGERRHLELKKNEQTAVVGDIAIHKNYMGLHLTGLMMKKLEEELVRKGYLYLEQDAAIDNNYAANVKKNYADRIIESFEHGSMWGPEVFFRIKLPPAAA